MNIGIIAPFDVLSGSSGANDRVFNIAKSISELGASVYVLHHGANKIFNSRFKFIQLKSFRLISGSGNYLHPFNVFFPSAIFNFLKKNSIDIIQCEQPWSAFSTILLSKKNSIPVILDEHNVESSWLRSSSRVPYLACYTQVLEKFSCTQSSLILATSEDDKKRLIQLYNIPKEKIIIVPNGVNLDNFSRITDSQRTLRNKLYAGMKKKIVLFHGTMSARQNFEAANIIIEYIAPQVQDALFVIIGRNAPQWLKNKAKKRLNVLLLGYVSNIEEYILASDLCIAPLLSGSGTRLKIIEYMAAAKPIVSTTIGAEGIPLKSGLNAFILEKVDFNFIDAVRYLLSNDSIAKQLGAEAKQLAKKFDWKSIGKSLFDYTIFSF